MTQNFVTIVRRRVVIEEIVITEEEFNSINSVETDDDTGMAYSNLYGLPFIPWPDNGDEDECIAYMVFTGDVSSSSDDLVSLSSTWQVDLPLTVDTCSYHDKLFDR